MNSNIVRAWKDEFYRQSLSDEERTQLPENPVGELDLTDEEMGSVFAAGGQQAGIYTYGACADVSFIVGGCYTRTYECRRPHVSYGYNWNDCGSYRYDGGNHFSYREDDCRTYREQR